MGNTIGNPATKTPSPANDRQHRHLPLHCCLLLRGTAGCLGGGGLFSCWGWGEQQNVITGGMLGSPLWQQRWHRWRLGSQDDSFLGRILWCWQRLFHRPPHHFLAMEKLRRESSLSGGDFTMDSCVYFYKQYPKVNKNLPVVSPLAGKCGRPLFLNFFQGRRDHLWQKWELMPKHS
jgi:hypothetical protein